jgi:signal transduction histidine kinase/ActR/RegA family two-component response regulator
MSTLPPATDPRIEADLVRALYAQTPRLCVTPLIAGAISVMVLWGPSSPLELLSWFALLAANCAARLALHRRFQAEPADLPRPKVWAGYFTVPTLINGLLFGSMAVFFYPADDPIRQIFILFSLAMAANAALAIAYYPPAMLLQLLGILGPAVWRFGIQAGESHVVATLGFAFYSLLLVFFGFTQTRVLQETVVTRRKNLELIEELRHKSEFAEAAQRKAEVASLAKSQFFAAASHDLRQPLQALGLYAASLREGKREPEDARKIDQILSSVDALESLFDELLDISKLDAGYVKPHRLHFPASRIFERLETSYAPLARRNRLTLEFEGGGTVLCSDPVLLERVLGNLVSNALRYTESGGVVVSCAVAAGTAAIGVADTGIGIPLEEQDRVFDEFYQLGNPERDRRKGLGLGLATVRRITQLLGHPMAMTSAERQGTTFRIQVPAGDASRVATGSAASSGAEVDALVGRSLLVIEDETMVRDGMVQLLRDWRCRVTAAASAADALALLREPPDAIVADYRLRENQNGIAAIAAVRERFGGSLPAILITGDTAPEIFAAARDNRLPLLTKPVRAARLRAALQHLLSERREPARAAD